MHMYTLASIHYYLLFVYVHVLICICGIFIFSLLLLSMNCHSDYDTIDGRIAGNRHPYPDIFQSAIQSPRLYE